MKRTLFRWDFIWEDS